MTTLTELVERAQKAHTAFRAAKPGTEDEANAVDNRLLAERTLLNHLYAHAADIAERERLEANVVIAWEHLKLQDIYPKEFDMEVDKLVEWLIAHADDGAAT